MNRCLCRKESLVQGEIQGSQSLRGGASSVMGEVTSSQVTPGWIRR